VIELINGYRNDGQVTLVFKHARSKPFQHYLNKISTEDVKFYMYELLKSVKHLADNGIMHRDIKPTNFLFDPSKKKGVLIDFGLSELELDSNGNPLKNGNNETVKRIAALQKSLRICNRTGTKGYMPPESLFNSKNQTSKVDIWAVGVIFLSFLA